MVQSFGRPVQTQTDGLPHIFPTPENLIVLNEPVENHLGSLGIISSRARTIEALANA